METTLVPDSRAASARTCAGPCLSRPPRRSRSAPLRRRRAAPAPLTVVFDDCTEFAGLGSLPAAQIQGLVPAGYSPASFGPGVAGMVARAARCEGISVGGSPAERGTVSQIGVNLVSPDGTGDINNYALLYVTRQPPAGRAAAALRPAGPASTRR